MNEMRPKAVNFSEINVKFILKDTNKEVRPHYAGSDLRCVIADKSCKFAAGSVLIGSPNLPTVVPKGSEI